MPEPIKIAGLQIEAGQKQRGWLPVSDIGAMSINMPFTVINGIEDGPRLVVMAGIHGSEYTGIEASIRLARNLDPAKLRGSVCIVHVVNLPAFQSRTQYMNPLDGKNLNKIRDNIPSPKAAGSISHRILYTLFSKVVYGSDACIDLHAGDLYEALSEPFIIYPITPDEKTNQTINQKHQNPSKQNCTNTTKNTQRTNPILNNLLKTHTKKQRNQQIKIQNTHNKTPQNQTNTQNKTMIN